MPLYTTNDEFVHYVQDCQSKGTAVTMARQERNGSARISTDQRKGALDRDLTEPESPYSLCECHE